MVLHKHCNNRSCSRSSLQLGLSIDQLVWSRRNLINLRVKDKTWKRGRYVSAIEILIPQTLKKAPKLIKQKGS